jgi:hypothetical protein
MAFKKGKYSYARNCSTGKLLFLKTVTERAAFNTEKQAMVLGPHGQ